MKKKNLVIQCVVYKFTFLQFKRSIAKLEIYRKFTNALAVCVIASVAWIGYEVRRDISSRTLIYIVVIISLCLCRSTLKQPIHSANNGKVHGSSLHSGTF